MRRFLNNILIVLIVMLAIANPAMALDCDPKQGVAVELDFKRGPEGQPLFGLPLRVIGEKCTDGESVYTLKGMPGKFRSGVAALDTFESIKRLLSFGIKPEELGEIMKFVEETSLAAATKK